MQTLTQWLDAHPPRSMPVEDVRRAQLAGLDTALLDVLARVSHDRIAALEERAATGGLCWGVGATLTAFCPTYALLGPAAYTGLSAKEAAAQSAAAAALMAAWDGAVHLAGDVPHGRAVPADHPLVRRLAGVCQAYRAAHPDPDHQLELSMDVCHPVKP